MGLILFEEGMLFCVIFISVLGFVYTELVCQLSLSYFFLYSSHHSFFSGHVYALQKTKS